MTAPPTLARQRILASPLRYPGGKGALYSGLRGIIRDNSLAGCTYVEPYAGGAGAGLALLVTGQVSKVVINDLDPAVHAFWSYLIRDPDSLTSRIETVPLTVDEWKKQKIIYASGTTDINALGFATFYLNRTNRSGVLNAGPIGGLKQTGNYLIDARFNRDNLVERVRTLRLLRRNIEVTCVDGLATIRRHAARPNTFVYADPPYFEKAGSLYMNSFRAEDHASLAQAMGKQANGNWLLTYDSVPQVHSLYPQFRIRPFNLRYSAHRVKTATELAVLSSTLNELPVGWPSIQKPASDRSAN